MRTKKALYNMSSSLVFQLVSIVCGLIVPRLIMTNFGSTYNGVISSATQFLNMITILTLGITGATRVQLYKTLSRKDIIATSRIMKATKQYMQKVGLAIIIYSAVLCIVYPYISNNDLTPTESATLIAIVSIGTFAQYFFGISNMTLLQADQSSYIINIINILKTIINTVCVVILVGVGASIYVVKLGSSLVFLLAPLVLDIYIHKRYRLIRDCEPDYSGIKGRKAVAFHSIANIVHDNTDILILTLFTDAKQISVYMIYYLVIGKVKSMLQVLTSGMEAVFGDMWAKQELESLNRYLRIYEYMIFAFTAVVFSCVGTLILPFIAQYTKNVTDISYYRVELAVLIPIAEAVFCIRQPYLLLVYATGNYEATKKGALAEAVINLTLSLVLVQYFGIAGVILGTLAANMFRTAQYSWFVSRKILDRDVKLIVYRLLWLVSCVVIIIPLGLLMESVLPLTNGWSGWIIEALAIFAISFTVTLLMSLLFYKDDLNNLLLIGKRGLQKVA